MSLQARCLRVSRRAAAYGYRPGSQGTCASRTITTTSTARIPGLPRVVSRREWLAHPHRTMAKPSAKTAPQEEKPWPRSLQILGYTMAAVGIPYSIAWFASSNAPVREILSRVIPNLDDVLRHHFGEEERHSVSYCDRPYETPQYQLDGEPTYKQRFQQIQIDLLEAVPVPVRVRLEPVGLMMEETLAGSVRASPREILKAVGSHEGEEVRVAVDFGGLPKEPQDAEVLSEDDTMEATGIKSSPLSQRTQTYSTWHYLVPQQQATSNSTSSSSSVSNQEMQVSKLKFEIEQLQRDLQDVNCTRDRDDMVRELREKKSELRRLQWKRRLGF